MNISYIERYFAYVLIGCMVFRDALLGYSALGYLIIMSWKLKRFFLSSENILCMRREHFYVGSFKWSLVLRTILYVSFFFVKINISY